MTKVYLAGAYSHPDPNIREERFNRANKIAAHLMDSGLCVYSPVSHSHPISFYTKHHANEGDFWLKQCTEMISWADKMYIINTPDNRQSVGVQLEIDMFRKLKKPIYSINDFHEVWGVYFD